jgi:hypothetical protein
MAGSGDMAHWITQLADSDPAKRAAAAHAVRVKAFTQCFSGSNDWIHDPEFREFTLPLAIGAPDDPRREQPRFVAGIAVQPHTFERIRLANGLPRLADVPASQDAIEFELHFGEEGDLDILTTRDSLGSGAIARYLAKFGEGIQQVEVNVSDVDRATDLLSTKFGLRPIYPAAQAGADQTRVNFFLLPAAEGKKCLIELVESAAAK